MKERWRRARGDEDGGLISGSNVGEAGFFGGGGRGYGEWRWWR